MKKTQWMGGLFALALGVASMGLGSSSADAAGIHSYGTSFHHTGYIGDVATGGRPKSGGTLTVDAGLSAPAGLDPITDTIDGTVGLSEYAAIYDLLVRYNPVTNKYVPQLAQSFSSNASHSAWTIHLRPDVTFTDGTPLNAAAVKFNLERYSGQGSIQYYAPELEEIQSIDTPNDLTVVVHLKDSDAQFIWMFTQGFGLIGSPTAIEKEGEQEFNLHPVGAGPFMVESYTPGDELVVVRNPHYWGGKVYLNAIHFVWPASDDTKLQALNSGDLSIAHVSDPTVISQALQQGYGGFTWLRYSGVAVLMNERSGHRASNVQVRKAIAYAINPSVINSRVFQGKGIPSSSLFPNGTLQTSVSGIGYNPAKARKLLNSVKRQTGWNGSIPILVSTDATQQAEALAIQAMLNAVGFHATLDTAPSISALIDDVYVTFNYNLAVTADDVTDSDPWAQMVEEFIGSYAPDGYDNPSMDAALNQLRAASTPTQLKAAAAKIQQIWNATVPEVWTSVGEDTVIWSKNIHGVVPSVQSSVLLGKAWES